MKNKGMSPVVTTFILILLVIVALGIIWVVVKNVIESEMPKFNITKEECWNDINIIPEDAKMFFYSVENINNKFNATFFDISSSDIEVRLGYEKEICKQVEVDGIRIIESDSDRGEFYNYYYKKEIKTDWLDENCECVRIFDEWDKKEKECSGSGCDLIKVEGYYCSKYKCEFEETYFVEVK